MIVTAKEHYLCKELTIGFSETMLGNTRIKQGEREGADYNRFSHRVELYAVPEESDLKIGDEVLVQHLVVDQKIEIDGEVYLVAFIEQIYGVKKRNDFDVDSKRYLENFDGIEGYLAYPHKVLGGEFVRAETAQERCEENYAITFCGKEVEYLTNADYEFFINDFRVHFIMKKKCFCINGEANSEVFEEVVKDGEDYRSLKGELLILISENVFENKEGRSFCLLEEIGAREVIDG